MSDKEIPVTMNGEVVGTATVDETGLATGVIFTKEALVDIETAYVGDVSVQGDNYLKFVNGTVLRGSLINASGVEVDLDFEIDLKKEEK